MGRALGVLHTSAPVGKPPTTRQIAQLTTLGIQAGARIGTVRAFNSTQRRATTDSLTGLPNRSPPKSGPGTSTARAKRSPWSWRIFDHFKRLNDSRDMRRAIRRSGSLPKPCV